MYTCKNCYHYNDCNKEVMFDINQIPSKNCITFINKKDNNIMKTLRVTFYNGSELFLDDIGVVRINEDKQELYYENIYDFQGQGTAISTEDIQTIEVK